MKLQICTICLVLLSLSCTNSRVNTKNKTAVDQEPIYQLVMSGEKQFSPILHDPYRNLYYRYYFKPAPSATSKTPISKKPFAIILLDEQFNYLGETNIGVGDEWNWQNSFVTSEGLNIEYTGEESDDDHLILKIFTPEKL